MNLFTKECKATTDLSENPRGFDESIKISTKYLSKDQYLKGPTKKQWLFLHHTAGWQDPYNTISAWDRDDRGKIGTEFVIGGQSVKGDNEKFDGEIVQAFPAGGYAWHLGTGNNLVHTNSVGIEVCNFGQINNGKTYVDVVANPHQIVKLAKSFRGYQYWHKYSDKQIESLRQLILFIGNRDSIDIRAGLASMIKTKGSYEAFDFYDLAYVTKNKGMYCHTNVQRGKVDMFPQQELVDMLVSL